MRTALTILGAALAIYVSTPGIGTSAQGSSVGEERLYAVAQDTMLYHLPAATVTPETTVGSRSGTGCYPGYSHQSEFLNLAPDGTFYGFVEDCPDGGYYWGRLDPETAVITKLHPIPADPLTIPVMRLKPAFVTAFGPPGSALGYRIVVDALHNGASPLLGPTDLYQVDALMPYREHLVLANIGPANYGIGTVIRPATGFQPFGDAYDINYNGYEIYVVSREGVYILRRDCCDWKLWKIVFLTQYNHHTFSTVTNFDDSNTFFHIVDRDRTLKISPWSTPTVEVLQFPNGIAIDSAVIRRTPWGGVRIEPHEGLTTTENGGTATFTAVLTAPPIASVTVNFTSSDTSEGTVSPSSAMFTTGNWNVAQTITVTGVADSDLANQAYSIVTAATSADLNYHARAILDVDVTNAHINQLPTMTPGTPSVQQGSPAAGATLGTVSDLETAAGALSVTALSVPSGVTVGTVTNTAGTITAPLGATCAATPGSHTLSLRVTDAADAIRDQDVTVTVTANAAPTLGTYADKTVAVGAGTTSSPSAAPADNVSLSSVQVAAPSLSGAVSVDALTGTVTIANGAPMGTHTITVTATDNCGATVVRTFALTVTCTSGCNWTDATLIGTPIRAAHVLELRARIDALRQRLTMTAFEWTDAAINVTATGVRAVHINELRTALLAAYGQAAQPVPSFNDVPIVAGVTAVRAMHITELRTAVEGLEVNLP